MEAPEWWLRVQHHRCVLGIWLQHDPLGQTIYYQLLERWIWDVERLGCGMKKVGQPRAARTLIEAQRREAR